MLEYVSKLVSAFAGMNPFTALVLVVGGVASLIVWVSKDRLKEVVEAKKALSSAAAVPEEKKCVLCKYQVAEVVRQTTDKVRDMRLDLLDRQMKSMEKMCDRITHRLVQDYLVFLRRWDSSADLDGWEMMLVRCKIEIAMRGLLLPGLRQMLKENHLADRREGEWAMYKKTNLQTIKAGMMDYVSKSYTESYSVPRADKYNHFERAFDDVVASELNKELDEAKALARLYEDEIRDIEKSTKDSVFSEQPGINIKAGLSLQQR